MRLGHKDEASRVLSLKRLTLGLCFFENLETEELISIFDTLLTYGDPTRISDKPSILFVEFSAKFSVFMPNSLLTRASLKIGGCLGGVGWSWYLSRDTFKIKFYFFFSLDPCSRSVRHGEDSRFCFFLFENRSCSLSNSILLRAFYFLM